MPFPLTPWLVHPNPATVSVSEQRFLNIEGVDPPRVFACKMEELPPHDAFVTAANSFGHMTAGVDAAVVRFHGEGLMARVQHRILDEYLGEQPVGTAFVIDTGTRGYPYVVHAPTMRVPCDISGTDAVYAATWAVLLAVYRHNAAARREGRDEEAIRTVALPAMGCGFGGMAADEAARQMAAAFRFYASPPHRLDWDAVIERQRAIRYDGDRRVL